ncbi:TatD family hydrolase [Nocardia cyriacigeorgica]|uniref:TatD family hydrolase n=1 Tax=Nocardia cyriacigeorgica TaxID=135487 RepID=UPI00189495A4|nr:TatD family hydrolase [Nocardia cyriacigeorgica]MBF6513005.1 TatD family hydrolase [Nocardia cyriacigeorgica]
MSRQLPSLDTHAHVDTSVSQRDMEALGAVVFVATRSQQEFARTLTRRDQVVVWGLGCHPGVPDAQAAFDAHTFREQLTWTPFVSEVGLDARSTVPTADQQRTFRTVLEICNDSPRILSVHSAGRTRNVLELIEELQTAGVVLHWWLGTEQETRQALELGCYFSVNHAMLGKSQLHRIPLSRLLLETDHPSGDRRSPRPRRPGATNALEEELARHHGIDIGAMRTLQWQNMARLVDQQGVDHLLPTAIQRMLAHVRR